MLGEGEGVARSTIVFSKEAGSAIITKNTNTKIISAFKVKLVNL